MVEVHVEPRRSMVDESLKIQLTGLEPGQRVTLRASQADDRERTWRAHATFVADSSGQVDVAEQAPVSGTYANVDAMGLIWSMTRDAEVHPPPASGLSPIPLLLTAECDGRVIANEREHPITRMDPALCAGDLRSGTCRIE